MAMLALQPVGVFGGGTPVYVPNPIGEKLYRTIIPRNVRLAEAPSHGIPAFKLEPQSKGALAYLALAGEMLRRIEARELAHELANEPANKLANEQANDSANTA